MGWQRTRIQKIVVMAIVLIIVVYGYSTFVLGPLQKGQAAAVRQAADLQQKLANADPELRKLARVEDEAAVGKAHLQQLQAGMPTGAPLAWFPPQMKTFFDRNRVQVSLVRQVNSFAPRSPELSKFVVSDWVLEIPQTDYATAGTAIAALENDHPRLPIKHLKIGQASEASAEFPTHRADGVSPAQSFKLALVKTWNCSARSRVMHLPG